jgi:hypothetical protein
MPQQIPCLTGTYCYTEQGSQEETVTVTGRRNWLCQVGNFFEFLAEKGGQASLAIEGAGVVVTGVGLAGAEPLVPAGGAMMATGGWGTIGSTALQGLGGVAQWAGGQGETGRQNAGYAAVALLFSGGLLATNRYLQTAGKTVSQRVFNDSLDRGAAVAGATLDATAYLSPDMAPAEAECEP